MNLKRRSRCTFAGLFLYVHPKRIRGKMITRSAYHVNSGICDYHVNCTALAKEHTLLCVTIESLRDSPETTIKRQSSISPL